MAATAYSYRSSVQRQPDRRAVNRPSRPDVRTVRGNQFQREVRVLPNTATLLAVVLAVVFVVIAVLAFTRIYLSSQAIVTSIASEEIESSIAQARSEGSVLEVQTSVMANATTVKEKAEKLGMSEPTYVTYITLPKDVVAVSEDGSLSLTESIAIASGTASGE